MFQCLFCLQITLLKSTSRRHPTDRSKCSAGGIGGHVDSSTCSGPTVQKESICVFFSCTFRFLQIESLLFKSTPRRHSIDLSESYAGVGGYVDSPTCSGVQKARKLPFAPPLPTRFNIHESNEKQQDRPRGVVR